MSTTGTQAGFQENASPLVFGHQVEKRREGGQHFPREEGQDEEEGVQAH